jgi:hypothetical protein
MDCFERELGAPGPERAKRAEVEELEFGPSNELVPKRAKREEVRFISF